MKYTLSKLNRIVELNDKFVEIYERKHELSEDTFSILLKAYGDKYPTEKEISSEELSRLCNGILITNILLHKILEKENIDTKT